MSTARSCHLASLALLFLSLPGCGTTSRSEGSAAGQPEARRGGAPCPVPRDGFPMRQPLRGVVGCPSDITTSPGPDDGYQVMFGCPDRGASDTVVVIQGLGRKSFRQMLGPAPSADEDGERAAWRRFADNVRKNTLALSIHRSGRIHACHSAGYAVELGIHSFREVDDVIRALGAWLARMDSNGEVMLVIEPKPDLAE